MKAASTTLAPGTTSIDRATPRQRADGEWVIDWRIRLQDGRLKAKRSQGKTKGAARARAKAVAEEMLRSSNTQWRLGDLLSAYFEAISKPVIDKTALRPASRARYAQCCDLLFGKCEQHKHTDSLAGHTIDSGTRVRALEACLQEIARLHGGETARQCQNVASKYLLGELVRDDLLRSNPLYGVRLDLKTHAKVREGAKRGGQSLTQAQYDRVLQHLLDYDAESAVPEKQQSRWTHADRAAKVQNTVDLTLLQMATGLRVREALTATWDDVVVDANGTMLITVSKERSKTHRARAVPVLKPEVAHRLLGRRNAQNGEGYVIGSPSDPYSPWHPDNARKAVAELYKQLAAKLDVPLLATARTHVWRATLNTLLVEEVPEVVRAAFFGHTGEVNRASYTDTTDVSSMVTAAERRLHAVRSA